MTPLEKMAERARHEPFFLGWLLEQYAAPQELSDAVFDVHYVIARLEIELIGGKGAEMRFPPGPGDHVRGVEKIFGSEDGNTGIVENGPARDRPANQVDARDSTSQIRASGGPTSTVTTRWWGPTATAEITRVPEPIAATAEPERDCIHLTANGTNASSSTKTATVTRVWLISLVRPC